MLASIKRGYPNRIWSSKDPKWDEFKSTNSTAAGSLIVATVTRVEDEIYPRNYVPETSLQKTYQQAQEMMAEFEKTGALWDNHLARQIREEAEKAERAQAGLASAIASAIREGNSGAKK